MLKSHKSQMFVPASHKELKARQLLQFVSDKVLFNSFINNREKSAEGNPTFKFRLLFPNNKLLFNLLFSKNKLSEAILLIVLP